MLCNVLRRGFRGRDKTHNKNPEKMNRCLIFIVVCLTLSCSMGIQSKIPSYYDVSEKNFTWIFPTNEYSGYLFVRQDSICLKSGQNVLILNKQGIIKHSFVDSMKILNKNNWQVLSHEECRRIQFDIKCKLSLIDSSKIRRAFFEESNHNRRGFSSLQQMNFQNLEKNRECVLLFGAAYIVVYDLVQASPSEFVLLFTQHPPFQGGNPKMKLGLLNILKLTENAGESGPGMIMRKSKEIYDRLHTEDDPIKGEK
jgi:hypothetical protein